MAKIFVYNNDLDKMEIFYKEESDPMPYNTNKSLLVGEFRGSSKSNILWTTKRAMQAWNSQRYLFGKPIPLGFAFKRPYEGGHGSQSQHYAGTAFDAGQALSSEERNSLWDSANESEIWTYVEPQSLTPTWVHMDKRFGEPACPTGGYPILKKGSLNTYVLILQDNLNTLGYKTNGLDGIFGTSTEKALKEYQQKMGLPVDGIVGCSTWRAIQEDVVGNGETSTTIKE